MGVTRADLVAAVEAHGVLVRIVIAEHAGSAPRESGTAMLVWAEGQSGTIGGGALEWEAARRARAVLGRGAGADEVMRVPLGPALGQCCGGSVTLVLERIDSATLGTIPESGAWARRVAGDADQPLWLTRALRDARGGAPVAMRLDDGWLIEPMAEERVPLWLYGAGHVGRAIVGALTGLPFDITWVDTARDRFPADIPAHARPFVAATPPDAVGHAPDDAIHLVLTYSHEIDLALCHAVLSRPFARLGLIGSATKKARFVKRLASLGHAPERLAQLTCPIGDPDLGKHPQAIAVGVVAALLKDKAADSVAANRGQTA